MTHAYLLDPALPADPAMGYAETLTYDDLSIAVNDRVSYFPPGAWEARTATVECVRPDGQLLLRFAFSGMRWAWASDCTSRRLHGRC